MDGDLSVRWLKVHNEYRCAHGSPALEWDVAVAASAQEWANAGNFAHSSSYALAPPAGPAGENLAMGHGTLEAAVRDWYNEVDDCTTLPGCQSGTGGAAVGHFTALIWKSSKSLGCGYNPSNRLYVCRYANAPANYGGLTQYNANVLTRTAEPTSCGYGLNGAFATDLPPDNVVGLVLGSLGAAALVALLLVSALLLLVCCPTCGGGGEGSGSRIRSAEPNAAHARRANENAEGQSNVDSRPLCRRCPPLPCWPILILVALGAAATLSALVLVNVGLGDPELAPFVRGSWTALWLTITASVGLGIAAILAIGTLFAVATSTPCIANGAGSANAASRGVEGDASGSKCRACCAHFAAMLIQLGAALRASAFAGIAALFSAALAAALLAALVAVDGFNGDGLHEWEYAMGIVCGYGAVALFGAAAIGYAWVAAAPCASVGAANRSGGVGGARAVAAQHGGGGGGGEGSSCMCCGRPCGSGGGDDGASSAGQPSASRTAQMRGTKTATRNPGKVRVKASARPLAPTYSRNSVAVGSHIGKWRAYRDPRTNHKYYYNASSGETSWDPPRS